MEEEKKERLKRRFCPQGGTQPKDDVFWLTKKMIV